jgi:serine/threonine protein kinase
VLRTVCGPFSTCFLKVNVLIDDGENAVLCDFGLTQLKADIIRRTSKEDSGLVMGSRNWMAPERFCGGALREACDVYSFGMTIFEVSWLFHHGIRLCSEFLCKIHTNEVPLGLISPSDFINSVINRNVRPERPNLREAPQLSDTIWSLAQQCWVKHPHMRPNINTVCETLQSKLMVGENLSFFVTHSIMFLGLSLRNCMRFHHRQNHSTLALHREHIQIADPLHCNPSYLHRPLR